MSSKADSIVDLYTDLQQQIIFRIINLIGATNADKVDASNVLLWQAEQLKKAGLLSNQTIELLADVTGKAESQIRSLVLDDGRTINNEINRQLANLTDTHPHVMPDNSNILNNLLNQTYKDINNVTNETLGGSNQANNSAVRAFRKVINQSTVETISGLKTHERAVNDAIYQLADSGLETNLVDSAGRRWALDSYVRSVINTTAHRTFNETRMNSMNEFGVTLVTMDSHAASRPACAPTHDSISLLAQPYPSPCSSLVVLGEALLESRTPPPSPRHRAAAGWSLPQPLLLPLLDQGVGDVTGLYMC